MINASENNLCNTPDTPATVDTLVTLEPVDCFNSKLPDTSETPETLDISEFVSSYSEGSLICISLEPHVAKVYGQSLAVALPARLISSLPAPPPRACPARSPCLLLALSPPCLSPPPHACPA